MIDCFSLHQSFTCFLIGWFRSFSWLRIRWVSYLFSFWWIALVLYRSQIVHLSNLFIILLYLSSLYINSFDISFQMAYLDYSCSAQPYTTPLEEAPRVCYHRRCNYKIFIDWYLRPISCKCSRSVDKNISRGGRLCRWAMQGEISVRSICKFFLIFWPCSFEIES